MGLRSAYAPGTFCWIDLPTTDVDGATAFYAALLSWEPRDIPVTIGPAYRMMLRDGHEVCAISPIPEPTRAAGGRPAWLSYVCVEDAGAAASRAEALGGKVLAGPYDVADAGRMATIEDPQGAELAVWQPRRHVGARLVNDPGALCLNQLDTPDPAAASSFYSQLFGWAIDRVATDPQPYWGISNAGALNGGMMRLDPSLGTAAHWLVYLTSDDLDASAETIGRLGGRLLVEPTRIPSGRILVASDPQGAVFALFEGEVDP